MATIADTILYVGIFLVPFAFWGFASFFKFLNKIMKIKKGFIETRILTESGQEKMKWIKPKGGSLDIGKDKTASFKDKVGFIWRDGSKPITTVRESDLKQLDLLELEENKSGISADDTSNLLIRSYQLGFIKGFRKNQMMNNFVMYSLVGIIACTLVSLLIYKNTMDILTAVRSGVLV